MQHSLGWKQFGHSGRIVSFPNQTSAMKKTSAIKELSSKVILTADKGVSMVVMDRQNYLNRVQKLLGDKDVYRPIPTDPTSRLKNKLIHTLRNIKTTGRLSDYLYKRLY